MNEAEMAKVIDRLHWRDILVLCNEVQLHAPNRMIMKQWITELRRQAVECLSEIIIPMSDYGDVFTLEEFQKHVDEGMFIDYDGTGYYMVDEKTETAVPCRPSDVKSGIVFRHVSHVAWYNK